MKPKIYISHPALSIEEIAKMVGVSKRRTKELIALADELSSPKTPRSVGSNGKPPARKRSAQTVTGTKGS